MIVLTHWLRGIHGSGDGCGLGRGGCGLIQGNIQGTWVWLPGAAPPQLPGLGGDIVQLYDKMK